MPVIAAQSKSNVIQAKQIDMRATWTRRNRRRSLAERGLVQPSELMERRRLTTMVCSLAVSVVHVVRRHHEQMSVSGTAVTGSFEADASRA